MSAEILREAAAEIRDEWSENRQMGQDRTEWRTWRAVADWLDSEARGLELASEYGGHVAHSEDHALTVARAYLGESA